MIKIEDIVEKRKDREEYNSIYNKYVIDSIYTNFASGINKVGIRCSFSKSDLVTQELMFSSDRLIPDNKMVNPNWKPINMNDYLNEESEM